MSNEQLAVRLRVAILGTRGIPANYGGFETFAEQLAVRLVQRGHEVTVYAEETRSDRPDESYQGVRVRFRRRPSFGSISVIAYDCACMWDARQSYDLVYMLGYGAAWACWLPRIFGVPVWINVDGLEWARSKWGFLARTYLKLMERVATLTATRVIADAQAIAERFRRIYPRGAVCSYLAYGAPVVPEPISDPESHVRILEAQGLKNDAYFLVVARLEPENHVLEILQGYHLYRQRGGFLPLVIVGDNTHPSVYRKILCACETPGVQFQGAIFDVTILQTLRLGARAYVHGHSVGGTNPSLLESLGCGNAVIAHDNPFNREVLGEEVAHYFCEPSEIASAMEAIDAMPPAALHERRRCAREIVSARYTWESIVSQYAALLLIDSRKVIV